MRIVAALLMTAALCSPAEATWEGCARVLPTPDGFAALREEPSTTSRIVAKLKVGEIISVSTRGGFDNPGWTIVEGVDRPGLRYGETDGYSVGWIHLSLIEEGLEDVDC